MSEFIRSALIGMIGQSSQMLDACKELRDLGMSKAGIYSLVKEAWPGSVDTLDEVAQEVFGDPMYVGHEE